MNPSVHILLVAALCLGTPAFVDAADRYIPVAGVIDGDTIKLANGERVRLIGVDTPETVHPKKPVERFGREATAFLRGLLDGTSVRLEYD